ncbi:D-beta-hydroxybutyrate dehydrogenase, mitochondrial (Fragments) [Lemmus lemmus]
MMLAARLRPLSPLPGKTLSVCDRENVTRHTLLFYPASFTATTCRTYASEANEASGKAVLITGCDSGFGFSLAKHLHSKGFLVFAGCLMKEVAEVNLWGTVRTTKSFLPLLRRAKGRMANPARSPYCITKFGVEAFSDCLRYEMHPLGVKVSVVEPGNFIAATSLYSPERMWDELPEVVRRYHPMDYYWWLRMQIMTHFPGAISDKIYIH